MVDDDLPFEKQKENSIEYYRTFEDSIINDLFGGFEVKVKNCSKCTK